MWDELKWGREWLVDLLGVVVGKMVKEVKKNRREVVEYGEIWNVRYRGESIV